MGITPSKIRAAQKAAMSFWIKGVELQQVIEESRANFRVFFKWLHGEIAKLSDVVVPENLSKMSQQEVLFLAEFLDDFDVERQEVDREDEIQDSLALGDEDEEMAGNFTHRHLEKVGQYLKDTELEQLVDRSKNPWHSFLRDNASDFKVSRKQCTVSAAIFGINYAKPNHIVAFTPCAD